MATPSPDRSRVRRRAASAALLFVVLAALPAAAQETDPVALAEQALTDEAARNELRSLSPEADEALTGGDAEVRSRLQALADQRRYTTDGDAREIAQRILDQERFATARENTAASFWEYWQRRVGLWINQLIASIITNVPGGPRLFFGLLILVVLAAVGFWASRLAGSRIRDTEAAALARIRRERGLSPAELRRRAGDAALAGDHGEAVRLLFLAGLTTLDERDRIEFSPGTTTDEISDELANSTFDDLARRFNEIVYGRRPAVSQDYEQSQLGWTSVLESA